MSALQLLMRNQELAIGKVIRWKVEIRRAISLPMLNENPSFLWVTRSIIKRQMALLRRRDEHSQKYRRDTLKHSRSTTGRNSPIMKGWRKLQTRRYILRIPIIAGSED